MIINLLALLLMVALGMIARRAYRIDPRKLSEVTMDLFLPPFIFFSILDAELRAEDLFHPAAACTVVILGAIVILRLLNRNLVAYALPIAFMNSGYLAIPVAESLGGKEWVARALIYDQMMNLLIFTVGIGILPAASGMRARVKLFLFNPALISIFLAAAWRAADFGFPEALRTLLRFPAEAAIPVALFSLGAALHDLRITNLRPVIFATFARYGLGAILAGAYIAIARPDAETAKVILLSSTMPAAVFSFLLSERYGGNAEYAAGVVFLSTAIYPLVFALLYAAGVL